MSTVKARSKESIQHGSSKLLRVTELASESSKRKQTRAARAEPSTAYAEYMGIPVMNRCLERPAVHVCGTVIATAATVEIIKSAGLLLGPGELLRFLALLVVA